MKIDQINVTEKQLLNMTLFKMPSASVYEDEEPQIFSPSLTFSTTISASSVCPQLLAENANAEKIPAVRITKPTLDISAMYALTS